MITYLVCDQDGFIGITESEITAHFVANPTHTSHIGIEGDLGSPTPYPGGSSTISQVTTDPVSPTAGTTWVLATDQGAIGTPIGLLLSLTHANSLFVYQLSYRTAQGTTIRTNLS